MEIDTSTTAGKIAVMEAFERGARIETRLHGCSTWYRIQSALVPSWNWTEHDYRIAPDPDAEAEALWKAEMLKAWEDGELEFNQSKDSENWVPLRGSIPPVFHYPRTEYRRRPKPTYRPWNCPEDVPGPVCWISGYTKEYHNLVTSVYPDGVQLNGGPKVILWKEFEECGRYWFYSTDRKTWHPCTVEVEG